MERMKHARGACRWVAAGLLVWLVALPCAAGAGLDAEAAEQLVRETWFEGLPLKQAAQIDAAGAARLVALLEDPEARALHANILLALAACAQPGSYDAIAAWALQPHTGEVDRATFRAWQTLPHALGTLAPKDRRALQLLASQLDAAPPGWRFRHHDAPRIGRLTRRGAASALAASGLPEAGTLLRGAEARQHADPSFRQHLREVRELHRQQARGQGR